MSMACFCRHRHHLHILPPPPIAPRRHRAVMRQNHVSLRAGSGRHRGGPAHWLISRDGRMYIRNARALVLVADSRPRYPHWLHRPPRPMQAHRSRWRCAQGGARPGTGWQDSGRGAGARGWPAGLLIRDLGPGQEWSPGGSRRRTRRGRRVGVAGAGTAGRPGGRTRTTRPSIAADGCKSRTIVLPRHAPERPQTPLRRHCLPPPYRAYP